MEFSQQENNQNSIVSISDDTVDLGHSQLKTPCFISSSFSCEVTITDIKNIDKASLFPLINKNSVDILIIGTGSLPKFLSGKQQVAIQQMGVGVESMNSESACRSFNLLLSDVRNVGLLLL